MAKRKSVNFLPQVFNTLSNKRFLNATMDPLIQEPSLKKMYGYIGQQDQSPVYTTGDYYINEGDSYSQFYQLEPGVVINKRQLGTNTYKVNNVYSYVDILNQISADGGINNNHDRLFTNRYYSYNGFVDLDKLTNYRQYYWVPGGPLTVDVTADTVTTQQDFYIHRNSYIANNETELQSAALGETGYSVDGYNNVINPTLTLIRGGSYNFHVNQGTQFWIQTETGTSGESSVQNNISTRDVMGVSNNGDESGIVTFTVPLSTAQDYLINYPAITQQVDIIVDGITYDQLQGQNYDTFVQSNSLDGVRSFDGKFIVFTSLTGFTGVDSSQFGGVWQINVDNNSTLPDMVTPNPNYRNMNLTYIAPWANLYKVFVGQGDVYGHVYAYKNNVGVITKFPTLSAAQSVLYYVDATNPLVYGEIRLVDPTPNSLLNVTDIIGRVNYTSPNGVKFSSGLKVKFTGLVFPSEYQNNEYIVEGVGTSISLIKYSDLVTPEIINTNLGSSFGNGQGYDANGSGFDGTSNSPEEKDYVTINRASVDGNAWSRNNRWFHHDVLQYAADFNNTNYSFDSNQQAKRPIVEFLPNLKLFNYGVNYRGPVTVIDTTTTDAFSQIEGQSPQATSKYYTDGIPLLNNSTVVFTQDTNPTVRNTIYKVQNNKIHSYNNFNVRIVAFSAAGTNIIYVNDLTNLYVGLKVTAGSSWTQSAIPNNTYITAIDDITGAITLSKNLTDNISPSRLIPATTAIGSTVTNTPYYNAQKLVTVPLSIGINTFTVYDISYLSVGQLVTGTGVPNNTTITSIVAQSDPSGATTPWQITVSNNFTVNATETLTIASAGVTGISTGQIVNDTNTINPAIPAGTAVGTIVGGNIHLGANATLTENNVVFAFNNPVDTTDYTVLTFSSDSYQIHLVPSGTVNNGDTVIPMEGVSNQGNMFYYIDGTWNLAQVRNSRPQFPLFDVIDSNSYSLGDHSVYPSSNFKGSKLFGYAIGTGTRDSELGFPLVYKSIGNLGDIVFQNYYQTDSFDYNLNQVDTIKNVNIGYGAIINSYDNYNFANGWYKVADKSKQYITKTFNATDISLNNFDLKIKYENSYYENNVFVYINGKLQNQDTYTLKTNSTTSVVVLNQDLNIGDRLFVKIFGTTPQYKQTYTMPRNLTNNSDNTEFTSITLGQLRNHLIEIGDNLLNLVGEPAGSNNFRDLNFNDVGGKLLQHSASLRPASLLLANNDVDPVQIIRYAADSYTNFKSQLLDYISNTQFPDPNNYRASLDLILSQFTAVANGGSPYYYTDMAPSGTNFIKSTYTVQNTTYRSFNFTQSFADNIKQYTAAMIYLNGILLIKNHDYTINDKVVTISSTVALSRGDVIEINEYASTVGCNIPATPTKLGIYPKYEPQIVTDDTYVTPTTGIIGHDGSFTAAWGDYRDHILLEFEKRVYNNITTTYANSSDTGLNSVIPGAFRKTDYSIDEWTQLLAPAFLRWSNINNVDIFTNNTVTNNEFTWNYSSGTDKLFFNSVPGNWRGIYNYFYDTDKPHTNPWEMLGFAEQPSWWELRYGPAPYTSANNVLWSDLELGFIYGGNPNASYIDSRYSRLGLSQIIPVDEHGNLLSPNFSVIGSFDANLATQNWRVGDQGPAETAWRRSVDYPFAVQIAWFLARPAEWAALNYNTRDLTYNSTLGQIINSKSNSRVFDFSVTSPSDYIPGYNVWLRDYLTSNNLDVTENWLNVVNNSTFNLVYKMGAYTDKSYLTIVADQVSPQSTNSSVIIPQENYRVKVTKSAPVARAIYSAVVVQKTTDGYQITGFDKERPYFLTIPSLVSSNNYGITVGIDTAVIYLDAAAGIVSYPYGTIFNTKQQVVDFLVSYGRYLESQGFSFQEFLGDNNTKQDWTLAAKEFLFWDQQDWGNSTIISLTPTGTNINFNSLFGLVDTISNTNNYTKIINSDNVTLTGRDYRVYREDNNFSVTLKNAQKGIHLLDIAVVQYEHTLIFDNTTVFNDILYDEQTGSRQFRLRIDGSKTQDWDGSLYAPGFFVNISDIPEWSAYTDYYTGDIVLFKTQYFAAQNFIPGSATFKSSDWYTINGNLLGKDLIPNMASGAAQFINFHDPDATDLNSAADALSKSETGFSPRQYFTDLGLDTTTQYKFYLGMIAQKGTQAVLNAYLRNKQKRIDSDITLNEQWAIKLDNYGGNNDTDKLEFNIGNAIAINSQYLFQLINETDSRPLDYNGVKPSDLLYKPRKYNTDIFSLDSPHKQIIPTAGPVNTNDVSATVFDISKIFNISALNTILGEGSKIWIAADSSNQWGVYRLSQTNILAVTYVNPISPTELQFTTSAPHGLAKYDYVMLKNGQLLSAQSTSGVVDMSGFYRVSSVSGNTFNVKITNNVKVGTGNLKASLFKLINVRYATSNDFANFTPVRGWNSNEIVYIDNGPDGYNVLQNTNNWVYNQTKSPVFTSPSDNYGSSVKINHTQGFALVGANQKNTSGTAFVYGKNQDNTWQEFGVLTPDSRIRGFGSNVDINVNNIAFISAPTGQKGVVYTANVNSQQIALSQAIHYDNLYAISAGFSQSNNNILLSTVFNFDSTANIAVQASYNLSNFAVGMGVGGAGIPSGTYITSITPVAATNTIVVNKTNSVHIGDTATILQSNSSIFTTLYANIASSNANVYIGNVGQSITGVLVNTMPVLGNGIPVGTYITNISNITGYKVLTLSSNVTIPSGNLLTIVNNNSSVIQSGVTSVTTTGNNYFIISGAQSTYLIANGQPIVGSNLANGTVISNLAIGPAFNILGVNSNVNLSNSEKIAIYPNVQPTSNFGYSISASGDGKWLYVGEPVTNSVYVYEYANLATSTSTRIGDGHTTSFSYPIGAPSTASANDIKVYVSGVLKVPNLDYIKTPGQTVITFDNPPAANAAILISYESHYVETNRIVTDDPQASMFGASVSTNYDGSVVVIGAANSAATFSTTFSNAGKTYIYDRTAEIFTADGSTSTFQLSNAFANLTTITTPTLVTNPAVTVDGIDDTANATFNLVANQVTLATAPQSGSIVRVETNQFINTKIATTDVGQQNSNYGTAVKVSNDGSSAFSSATGYGLTSSQNGVIFYLKNIPQQYGTAIGTQSNFTMIANNAVRINDYLVTFTGGSVQQTVTDINNVNIPYVTASVLANNAISISSSDTVSAVKLRLRNEVGNPLTLMGITQWQTIQRLNNPLAQDTAHFGEILSLSADSNTLVVGSTLSNTKTRVTFDKAITTFDGAGLRFIDTVYQSGAAHVYEYQAVTDENYASYGNFAYATLLNDQFAKSYDRYGSGIDISDNFIMVGAPHANILNNATGAMYVYYNQNAQPVWQSIRSGGVDYDSRKVNRVYLYNSTTAKLIADLPVYDLINGFLPNESESYIDFVINYDPAVYNKVPTNVSFSYDRKNAWGKEKLGKLWWDTNSIKYYDNTQGKIIDRFNYWGLAFPGSKVNVYEWIESLVPPSQYVGSNANNVPLYTINDVYTSAVEIDSGTGQAVTKYYFWVKNSTLTNAIRPSALEIQGYLTVPRASSEPFAAVISQDSIAVFGASNLISVDTNLAIEYKDVLKPQLVHSEWTMFDDGSDLGVADEFLNKLSDSLTGQDVSGRIVPDPALPIGQKYGMSVMPRQSLFNKQFTGRKLFIENINQVCQTFPMALTRGDVVAALNHFDPLPNSSQYKKSVANITELGYLDKNVYQAGDVVLVINDSNNYTNGWSLYQLNVVFPNTRTWELVQVQTYNVNSYWTYTNWYSTKYNASIQPTHTVSTENDIANLTLNVNDIIYVTNSTAGGWKLVLVNSNNLELLAQENATIQFTNSLYDLVAANQGFQTSSFQNVGFDADSNLEFSYIFGVIKDKMLINEYRPNFKAAIKLMIDTIATQHQQTDWMMKTSFVDIYHRVRGLDQLPVYLPQPESTVTSFFAEVKPYHTKLKQYIAIYDNNNAIDYAYASATDFDLQPYKNSIINKYRSPQLGNSLDTTALSSQAVYQPWVNNHTYSVKFVGITNGGTGYDGTTTVTIIGDGTGATATAYIVNGSVNNILVTNPGTGYTYATAYIYGIGTGASATVIVGNGLARNFNTYIKYDRYTYFNNIQDWSSNTVYTTDTVVVYKTEPYRVTVAHTSGTTFDATKFVALAVKVWYPETSYAINDIVIYQNTSYVATQNFTSGVNFDSTVNNYSLQYWNPNTSYTTNNIVFNSNNYYSPRANYTSNSDINGDIYNSLFVTVSTTASNYVITVTNINGIAVGQYVTGAGVVGGSQVTAISGNSVTLSAPATSTGTNVIIFYTGNLQLTTVNLVPYTGMWLDNACDRVWAYYSPMSGMVGRDLAQVMTGIEYSGNQVVGPTFTQTPGYDVNNYDYIAYDYETFDAENVADTYGPQAEDTYIQSFFTDSGLGLRPQDINIVGGDFYDVYSSHAPEEFIPGQVLDTVDIKVKTLPITNGGPDIKIFTVNYIGSQTFSFDPNVTNVSYPVGGIEKFYIVDSTIGPIAETLNYTVNYQTKTITVNYIPQNGTYFYVMMIGANGVNPVYDQDFYADGVQTDFDIPDFTTSTVGQAYVKVNGAVVTNWSLVNKLENGNTVLAVRFTVAPAANAFVQVHLFNVAVGTRAYSEWYEQSFSIPVASYPTGYTFTLTNPEIYNEPISSYAIVRLNGSDLLPPQQSYYIGDGTTANFSMTNTWVETIANIVDPETIVLVNGVVKTNNIDYTIYHDPLNMAMPVVQFTVAPPSGSTIVISDSSQSDFKIYNGNQLVLRPNVVIANNSTLTVLTQGNHNSNNQYTKLFSGSTSNTSVVDNGLDTTGFDAVGLDAEYSNFISGVYYTLPNAVTNINEIYITLRNTGMTGGITLLPYRDFILGTPTTILLNSLLNVSATSVITVRIFGTPVREHTVEFRIFKDMRDNTRYYALRSIQTSLTANLAPSDQWIYVGDASVLQSPQLNTNNAGIIFINGERIAYGVVDSINNRLGQLRRGISGTGTPTLHQKGTLVSDNGSTLEIPNSRDTYNTVSANTYITGAPSIKFITANSYSGSSVISVTDVNNIAVNQLVFAGISGVIPANTTVTNIYKGNNAVSLSANLTANLTTNSVGNLLISNSVSFVTNILVTANSTIKQGIVFTNPGESIQTSSTSYAQFIRAQ